MSQTPREASVAPTASDSAREDRADLSMLEEAHSAAWVPSAREAMMQNCHGTTGLDPEDWQLRTGENAGSTHRDTLVMAPTGAGKSLAMYMTLFLNDHTRVVSLMPLNQLETMQIKQLQKWGFDTIVLNHETKTPELMRRIRRREFRALLTSPEMWEQVLHQFMSIPGWCEDLTFVVDECHCIPRWKDSFRKSYARIGQIRAHVSERVSFIACTATATAADEATIRHILQFGDDADIINLGNHRTNLRWEVRTMSGARQAVHEVDFMIPEHPSRAEDIEQQLLFADDRVLTHELAHHLRSRLPPELQHTVQVYHSLRTARQRAWMAYRYDTGDVRILVCTEAIAMGCDFRNITQVVQFMVPDSLTSWIQRAGRGGRDRTKICRCILLVQPSVFQLVAPRKKRKPKLVSTSTTSTKPAATARGGIFAELFGLQPAPPSVEAQDPPAADDEDGSDDDEDPDDERDDEIVMVEVEVEVPVDAAEDGAANPTSDPGKTPKTRKKTVRQAKVYAKKVPRDFREFIVTDDCRGKVIDKTYRNPPHPPAISGCCDRCIARAAARTPVPAAVAASGQHEQEVEAPVQIRREQGTGDRRLQALADAKARVTRWRHTVWKRDMRFSLLGPHVILADDDLKLISKRRGIDDVGGIRKTLPQWGLAEKYASELLVVLQEITHREAEERAEAQRQKDAELAQRRMEKEKEREAARAEKKQVQERARAAAARKREEKQQAKQAERDAKRLAGVAVRGRRTKLEIARATHALSGPSDPENNGPIASSSRVAVWMRQLDQSPRVALLLPLRSSIVPHFPPSTQPHIRAPVPLKTS